ncbi:hypothetical protein HZY62_18940 [Maribacter polysiphoniae]|uniref:O-antigen ligase-like membrane protein n=1 Tax=Maribacter polysiphoniae TaxID=429344 RepID=A0A316DS51_9FLAO|nr:hypothetical protein [Maribacter polysiphoniae]MBD1262680.1 hypothetical protein [Maribacter polysiphoniae]PWK21117.1 hypothetical protein LX92_03918 [Maribacter polysiphoniae]
MKALLTHINSIGFLVLGLLILYLLNPFNYGYAIGFILVAFVVVQGQFLSQNMDMDFFLLSLFSIIYALFYSFVAESSGQGKQFIVIYAATPPFFYLLGKFLLRNRLKPKIIFLLLFSVSFIFSLSALISVLLNFSEGGFTQLERNIPMFWNDMPVSATAMGAFLTFNMCIPALLISSQAKKGVLFNLIAVIIFILSLICAIRLGSRTQLGVFLITTLLSLFYIFPKQSIKKNMILIGVLGIVIFYVLSRVSFDVEADWLTSFSNRIGKGSSDIASGGGRTERWSKSIQYLFKKPLGWDVNEFGYSHNLWLDVLRVSGFIPFFLLIIYSIRSFNQIKKTITLKPKFIALNAQILIYSIAFFLLFMVEPIMEGIFSSFVLFCLFKGVINKYYTNFKQC